MLTGKVRPGDTSEDTRLVQRPTVADRLVKNDTGFAIAAQVQKAAAEIGCSPAQLALAWQRTRPVTSVIVGARTMAQLDDNLGSLDVTIPPQILTELDDTTRTGEEYPGAFIQIFQGWIRGGGSLH
jgi:aryl-alcohol dehydrogenase-like predicted oxidoreductase